MLPEAATPSPLLQLECRGRWPLPEDLVNPMAQVGPLRCQPLAPCRRLLPHRPYLVCRRLRGRVLRRSLLLGVWVGCLGRAQRCRRPLHSSSSSSSRSNRTLLVQLALTMQQQWRLHSCRRLQQRQQWHTQQRVRSGIPAPPLLIPLSQTQRWALLQWLLRRRSCFHLPHSLLRTLRKRRRQRGKALELVTLVAAVAARPAVLPAAVLPAAVLGSAPEAEGAAVSLLDRPWHTLQRAARPRKSRRAAAKSAVANVFWVPSHRTPHEPTQRLTWPRSFVVARLTL
mmetsp:Transcript_69259/g.198641  ORF Transcript_69259/g.198641 Transcript_69259/m.198641 type:complete len:284 (-) Transcript_69259:73-924(-)